MTDSTISFQGVKRARLLGVMLAACVTLPALAQPTSASNRKPPAIERKGLAIIVDASESICGYFSAGENDKKLAMLIKSSMAIRDPDANHRIYLLKQQSKNAVVASRDVVEAQPNLQAQALGLTEKSLKSGAACAPFNGIGSNLELIFDASSPSANSQGVLLITDGQMEEKYREKFVDGFVAWANKTQADGAVPYAGVALAQSQFAGRYYPVADPDAKRRVAGYELPAHKRPLLLMWFTRTPTLVPKLRAMVDALGGVKALTGDQGFVQHLLPLPAIGEAWLGANFGLADQLPLLLDAKPMIEVKATDTSRSNKVVADCLRAIVGDKAIVMEAPQTCADGKPLFDGVSEILVRFKINSNPFYQVRVKGAAPNAAAVITWRLNPRAFGDSPFQLAAALLDGGKVSSVASKFSVDSDHCPTSIAGDKKPPLTQALGNPAWSDACLDRLDGRAYQLDVLLEMLLSRGQATSNALLAPLANQAFTFSFKQRSAAR